MSSSGKYEMSGISQKVYYWDACIYLALLKNEQSHGKPHMDSIIQIAKDNFALKNTIITSVLTMTEVLSSSLTPGQEEAFLKTFKATNHTLYDVDYGIAKKARKFREAFLNHPSGKKFTTPDAIHAATAVVYKAHEMHTFDDGQKEKRQLGLLELNGHDGVEKLIICKPLVDLEMSFFDPPPSRPGEPN